MLTLFKTEDCPACKALALELSRKGIDFQVETSLDVAANLGIRSAPALITHEGTVLRTSQEIIRFLKAA